MPFIREIRPPHKCVIPESDLYIGSVYRCQYCMRAHVLVAMDEYDKPIWVKSDIRLSTIPPASEIEKLAQTEIDNYGLELDDLYIKDFEDDDREEEWYEEDY